MANDGENEKRILIVDDTDSEYVILERWLKIAFPDYKILHAKNGKEGVQMALQHNFYFIIMDHRMPEMWGLDATIQIRENEKKTQHKNIIISNSTETEFLEERFYVKNEAGEKTYIADGFLNKLNKNAKKTIARIIKILEECEKKAIDEPVDLPPPKKNRSEDINITSQPAESMSSEPEKTLCDDKTEQVKQATVVVSIPKLHSLLSQKQDYGPTQNPDSALTQNPDSASNCYLREINKRFQNS